MCILLIYSQLYDLYILQPTIQTVKPLIYSYVCKHIINAIDYAPRVLDDLYLINATLMSGGDTLLVSNDQFRDHLHHVASSDATMIRLLRQWQLSSQVKMLFNKGSLATLVVSGTIHV